MGEPKRERSQRNEGKERVKGKKRRASAFVLAFLAGVANLLFGGGGGMLVVPAVNRCLGAEEKRAHATAIAVMMPLSLISTIALTVKGVRDFSLGVPVALGATLGGVIGALLLKRIPKLLLSVLFYGVMIYAGIKFIL